MAMFHLQVSGTKPSDKWCRTIHVHARNLERAVEIVKDFHLFWPFSEVVENVGGDEATFEWKERELFAHLTAVSDREGD